MARADSRLLTRDAIWHEPERRRLVRLCAAISGDSNAAEDLAQETLLEAWRNRHKLRDPAGADRWLAAIARNVCRRWARRRGRDAAISAAVPADAAEQVDIETDLERAELVELLDRALAVLQPETREVLVHRFVHDSPHAEIADRLGLSVDAVSMRISRGKVVLRRALGSELHADAAALGFVEGALDAWRDTRVWCSECGMRRLLMRRSSPPEVVSFRCPGCHPGPSAISAQFALANPSFGRLIGGLVRPTAILARAAEWTRTYFGSGANAGDVRCTSCERGVSLRRYVRVDAQGDTQRHGLYAECVCGETVSSSLGSLALAVPELRRFRRDHLRIRPTAMRELNFRGARALVVGYEDVLRSAGADVVLARDTLRVLDVRIAA